MKKIIFGLLLVMSVGFIHAQTSNKILYDSLPPAARISFAKKYSRYTISNIEKSIDLSGVTTYLLTASWQQEPNVAIMLSLIYNVSGTVISTKKEKEVYYTGNEPSRPLPQHDGHQH